MKIKRILAVAMATTLVFGSTITAFAEGEGTSEGTGSYEGGEMQYPTLSVTLPTIPAGTYNYIADPNGLIAATSAAHYPNSDFSGGTTGVFFLTTPKTDAEGSKNIYTNKSAAQTLTNQNAQDIDVTVKLEQKTAGAEGIAYSDSATFENTDKDKKLYLAVTDDAAQDPKVSALSATSAATLTTTVAGKPSNYKPSWTSEGGYKYALKTKAENNDTDLTWNSCSFILTGALNKNATWEDGLTFPTIKVTWSYAEHTDITTADGGVTPYNGVFYVGSSTEAGFALGDDTITSVKVNGKTLTSEQYQLADDVNNADKKWVGVPGATIEEIEEDNGWAEGSTYEFEVIYGNNKYVATYTL